MTTKYPAFRDNTTFWEGKRIAWYNAAGIVRSGVIQSVGIAYRDGDKAARAVVQLGAQLDFPGEDWRMGHAIIWPDHLDAVYPLFEP